MNLNSGVKPNRPLPYSYLKDDELLKLTFSAAQAEKEATLVLLDYLLEVDTRRLYAAKAYSSLFVYIVKELKLSEPAASERVSAVRLMRAVPEVKTHLETGRLSLTNTAQIQRFIKTEEKTSTENKKISAPEKTKIIQDCLDQSKREVEKILFSKQSEPAKILAEEKVKRVSAVRTELKFTIGDETLKKLERVKEIMGDLSLDTVFDQALDALLVSEKKKRGMEIHRTASQPAESVRMKTASKLKTEINGQLQVGSKPESETTLIRKLSISPKPHSRFIPIELKRWVFKRSGGQCEFRDLVSKRRCESRYQLQIDHKIPFSLGGKTEPGNLRHLCRNHNLHSAKRWGLFTFVDKDPGL